jgi:trimeric autotransporter adhesin
MKVLQRIGLFLFLFTQLALCAFAQHGIITTYAGPGLPVNGAQAITQAIDSPTAVVADSAGGFYVSSRFRNRIYRITANGSLSLTAGVGTRGFSGDGGAATAAQLNYPGGLALDSAGNLYIADSNNNRIRKVTSAGIISTVAGNGTEGYSGDDGPATAAQLNSPDGLDMDAVGNLYIADINNSRIRMLTATGIISTIAGGATGRLREDGLATAAQLNGLHGVAADSAGNVFIADSNRIRKVTPAGIISTMAGNGTLGYSGDGDLATAAQLNTPYNVTVDSVGNLYIADGKNYRIRKVTPAGIISTVAGNGTYGYSGDGGTATAAQIIALDVAVDSAGNLYFTDSVNDRIRKVTAAGKISTVAGNGIKGYSGNGGLATAVQISPNDVAVDSAGNLYIADAYNNRIHKVTTAGKINTVVGNGPSGLNIDGKQYSGDGGLATAAQLNFPNGVAVDSAGNIFIAETGNRRIRKVTPSGKISTMAGNGTRGNDGDGGLATAAQLNSPHGLAVDSAGNLYIADNYRIRKVTPAGIISTMAGNGTLGYSGDGDLATAAQLNNGPTGLAVDSAGNLYIADLSNNRIRKVTTTGKISTVAGNGKQVYSGDGGPATSSALYYPTDVAVDSAGNLYIVDSQNHRIRKVTAAGIISTVAGNGDRGYSGDGGLATAAKLSGLISVAIDSAGNLYIVDSENHRIRKVTR